MSYKSVSRYDRLLVTVFIVLVVFLGLGWCEEEMVFSNSWAIEVKGGSHVADQLAEKHGFINKGLVRKTLNLYSLTVILLHSRLAVLRMCIILFILNLRLEFAVASPHSIQNIMILLQRNK